MKIEAGNVKMSVAGDLNSRRVLDPTSRPSAEFLIGSNYDGQAGSPEEA